MNKQAMLWLSFVMIPLLFILNQCGGSYQIEQAAMDPGVIYKTDMELYYDPQETIWWYEDMFPLTMTCELRDDDGLVIISQIFTWTLPLDGPAPTEPITMTEPVPLSWMLDDPLEPGIYSEWCRSEIDGHIGRSDPDVPCGTDGFCLANEWRAPCIWGSLFRGVSK